jgi:hypothetical protein
VCSSDLRLEKYYQNEGSAVRERILIPVGSHQFELQTVPDDIKEPPSTPPLVLQPAPTRLVRLLLAVCILLVLTVVVLAVRIVGQETAAQTARPAIPMFWKSFLANGRPTRTILPTPIFFSWPGPSNPRQDLMVRDTDVNFFDGDGATESSLLRELRGRYGAPSLAQDYTVSSDTFAAVRLTRYLDRLGFDTNVMSSASAPLEALDHDNVIAIGTWGTLAPLRLYLDRMSFQLLNHETVVPNRSPGPGEETEYRFQKQSIERSRWPGIIALLPGRDNRTHLLILASHQTSALVSFLTSKEGQDQLERLWRARQSPEYFEIVVEAEMNADVLVRFNARALHRFNP